MINSTLRLSPVHYTFFIYHIPPYIGTVQDNFSKILPSFSRSVYEFKNVLVFIICDALNIALLSFIHFFFLTAKIFYTGKTNERNRVGVVLDKSMETEVVDVIKKK